MAAKAFMVKSPAGMQWLFLSQCQVHGCILTALIVQPWLILDLCAIIIIIHFILIVLTVSQSWGPAQMIIIIIVFSSVRTKV